LTLLIASSKVSITNCGIFFTSQPLCVFCGGHAEVMAKRHESNIIEDFMMIIRKLWIDEAVGQRTILANLSDIPIAEIVGYRSPFLQTAGDPTFKVLKEKGFKYDCSMPTRTCSKPHPSYPYKLDKGFQQDCQVPPCPTGKYLKFWEVPMNDWWRMREIEGKNISTPCSMIDMCLPQPETAKDTFDYLLDNFNRYASNRAPFPIFMHESYIINEERHKGFFQFLNHLVIKDEVFFVTIQEVLNWLDAPLTVDNFKQTKCPDQKNMQLKCDPPSTQCRYEHVKQFWNNTKEFFICAEDNSRCPTEFPWTDNWDKVLR